MHESNAAEGVNKTDAKTLHSALHHASQLRFANEILVKYAGIYISPPRTLMFPELGVDQSDLLHKYTYTKEQREHFRDLREMTHHSVGMRQEKMDAPFLG